MKEVIIIRILIIEDEQDLLKALAKGLRLQGYAIDTAEDGLSGIELVTVNEYDLLILDLNLPAMDGLEVCRKVRALLPQLLIVMLTARSQPNDKIFGLDQGADDYMVKPFHFEELLARIRALFRRDMRGRDPHLRHGELLMDTTAKIVWRGTKRVELTRKEYGILEYLLRRPNETISAELLLEHVWDMNADPFSSTVRVHINSLRKKLRDAKNNVYIETVIGEGYRLGKPTAPHSMEESSFV
ncbi:response regulator transcription factor [Paenibacillus harenae]|uniref:DNA-binding response OmpR family regulator n=1 Tax=Paenibacillus harenae TaxID=306543 RepID=A0ABT9U894_PAEHA|nr:response regulator transcription factor [Paenibacillus harenae]MDQ0115873.1 DNA-binding response OmpR family regulator [Paenibacillus harenae]